MTEIELLRKQIVALQERISKIDKKQTCIVHFVTNETIPQSLNINTIYYNKDNTSIGLYDDYSKEWLWTNLSTLGLTFTDVSAFFINGTNTTVVVDPTNETIQINASGGNQIQADWNQTSNIALDYIKNKPTIPSPTVTYIRRSDYVLLDRKSYIGIAPTGSLETDAVWTIWVTITDASGVVLSNTQYLNKKWSERGLL